MRIPPASSRRGGAERALRGAVSAACPDGRKLVERDVAREARREAQRRRIEARTDRVRVVVEGVVAVAHAEERRFVEREDVVDRQGVDVAEEQTAARIGYGPVIISHRLAAAVTQVSRRRLVPTGEIVIELESLLVGAVVERARGREVAAPRSVARPVRHREEGHQGLPYLVLPAKRND